jgi:hypothetical protein
MPLGAVFRAGFAFLARNCLGQEDDMAFRWRALAAAIWGDESGATAIMAVSLSTVFVGATAVAVEVVPSCWTGWQRI